MSWYTTVTGLVQTTECNKSSFTIITAFCDCSLVSLVAARLDLRHVQPSRHNIVKSCSRRPTQLNSAQPNSTLFTFPLEHAASLTSRVFALFVKQMNHKPAHLCGCLLNKWATFGTKIFARFWDIVIFVLEYFSVHPVHVSLLSHVHRLLPSSRKS